MRHLGIAAAILLAGIGQAAEETPAVTGQYLEDRSSRVYGCPCEWSSEWASEGREIVLAWKISSGAFDGSDLAGLQLAAVLVGRVTLSEPTTLRRSTIYVDDAAPAAQRTAGVAWLRSRFGDTLGIVEAVHLAPIDIQVSADTASLRVGTTLELRLRRADFDRDTMPWATLLYEPIVRLESSTLATALRTRYTGPDLAIRWQRGDAIAAITGYFGRFRAR